MKHLSNSGVVRLALDGESPALRRRDEESPVDRGRTMLLRHFRRLAEMVNERLVQAFARGGYGVPWTVETLTTWTKVRALVTSLHNTYTSDVELALTVRESAAGMSVLERDASFDLAMTAVAAVSFVGIDNPLDGLEDTLRAEIQDAMAPEPPADAKPGLPLAVRFHRALDHLGRDADIIATETTTLEELSDRPSDKRSFDKIVAALQRITKQLNVLKAMVPSPPSDAR